MGGSYAVKWKRLGDILGSSLLIALTSPIQIFCAIAIRAGDGEAVIFRQVRAGRDGSPFTIYKFRTMRSDTEAISGGYPSADMVTSVGRFLRRTSLDELPQLYNILRGDMSFVGPRPALMEQVNRYSSQQRLRLGVRPGLTGAAQLRYRNDAPWSVRIKADIEYVETLSFLNDVKLVAMTLPKVVFASGQSLGQQAIEVDDLGKQDDHERD